MDETLSDIHHSLGQNTPIFDTKKNDDLSQDQKKEPLLHHAQNPRRQRTDSRSFTF
jgi:hypothetical protein